jgi:hypothetical protein
LGAFAAEISSPSSAAQWNTTDMMELFDKDLHKHTQNTVMAWIYNRRFQWAAELGLEISAANAPKLQQQA